jgi:hypothetical protein
MQFTIFVYEPPHDFDARSDPGRAAPYWGAWTAYAQALVEAGVMVSGNGLQQPGAAATLRLRDGQRLVQDGPYADTKEQLGGYFVIDVPDLDAAIAWAARCPGAQHGIMEVRPVNPHG